MITKKRIIIILICFVFFFLFFYKFKELGLLLLTTKSPKSSFIQTTASKFKIRTKTTVYQDRLNFNKVKYYADRSRRLESLPFVSGDTFRIFADGIIDQVNVFLPEDIFKKHRAIIFIKIDYLNLFFTRYFIKFKKEIILITHNGALPVTEQYKKYLENEKIVAWFAQNPSFFHPKLIAIPVGFINFHFNLKYYTIIEKFKKYGTKPWNDRKTLLYINFNEKTNLQERTRFLESFSHFKGVKILKKRLNFEDYFNNLNDAKFVLCPRGTGIDTHRFYETVLMGAIPVVQNSTLISIYNKTTALILPSIDNLNETMLLNPEHFIKSMNFSKDVILMEYWLKKIFSFG